MRMVEDQSELCRIAADRGLLWTCDESDDPLSPRGVTAAETTALGLQGRVVAVT